MEARKAATELLKQSQPLNQAEEQASGLPADGSSVCHLGRLQQELLTLKEIKERQYDLLNGFQDQLLVSEASLNTFSTEVENLKV